MNIFVLNREFKQIHIIDTYESFIWTDRYSAYGDFEFYVLANSEILDILQQDYYLWMAESEHLMIIDEREIVSDIDDGDKLIVRGKSLESILERRIIWVQTILNGNFQNAIKRLLNENIISPLISNRKISSFIFESSTDSRITSLTISAQFTGTNLYEAIKGLCDDRNLGFKVVLNDSNQFVFSLYIGADRSYAQETNPYVVFSPLFENVINMNYLESSKVLKNVGLVAGEDEGADRRTTVIGTDESDLARREMFIDARDISSNVGGDETPPTEEEYKALLAERGNSKMTEYVNIQSFEGDVETTQLYVFDRDFFLGDTIQMANSFGIEASARIDEVIFSVNNTGNSIVPTFNVVSN